MTKLRECLEKVERLERFAHSIARQPLPNELSEDEGSFEDAYEYMILDARQALQEVEG